MITASTIEVYAAECMRLWKLKPDQAAELWEGLKTFVFESYEDAANIADMATDEMPGISGYDVAEAIRQRAKEIAG